MEPFFALISLVCQISSPNIGESTKISCIDFMVNCPNSFNRTVERAEVEDCGKRWQAGEKYVEKSK